MKKVEYIVQKFYYPDYSDWTNIAVYSEDEYTKASEMYKYFSEKYNHIAGNSETRKFRLIKRTTIEPIVEVFQETF